ncbi:hypothetical protein [Enterovibrio norvegicus]|nr:hypothetical protein [Enterovibrio norvegicus]
MSESDLTPIRLHSLQGHWHSGVASSLKETPLSWSKTGASFSADPQGFEMLMRSKMQAQVTLSSASYINQVDVLTDVSNIAKNNASASIGGKPFIPLFFGGETTINGAEKYTNSAFDRCCKAWDLMN